MSEHIVSPRVYVLIFLALMVGTAITVAAAFVDLSFHVGGRTINVNAAVALAIAGIKAALVILFFMHVRWSTRLTWVVATAGFFWLLLLFTIVGDYISRGWVPGTLR